MPISDGKWCPNALVLILVESWLLDVPIEGLFDQDKGNPNNQEIKALSLMLNELLPMGQPVGEAVVEAVLDPGKGQL